MDVFLSNEEIRVSSRKRLLFVCPCTPDPQGTGWEQRAYAFLLGYSRLLDVDLWFTPSADNPDLVRLPQLAALCRSITCFYPSALNDAQSGLRTRLFSHLSSADVVHVFRMFEFVWNLRHKRIVWDIDEIPWQLRPAGWGPGVPATPADQLAQFGTVFAQCVGKCPVIFGCSPLERPDGCATFVVVPNVVQSPPSTEAAATDKDIGVLFVGSLNHYPNTEGLLFLKDDVLPILQGIEPGIRVDVVGRSPATDLARAAVDRLRQDGRFRFSFDVPDCASFYRRAAVSIAPIRSGGGTRVKIIESFAHRCPVVSTAKGCEGMEVRHGQELLIADSPQDFAQACARLLHDPALRRRIAEAAYGFFRREHSQDVVDARLASTIGDLFKY